MSETQSTEAAQIEAATASLVQVGMDRAARLALALLDKANPEVDAEGYADGIEDVLLTLIAAGATDPR